MCPNDVKTGLKKAFNVRPEDELEGKACSEGVSRGS